jgi:hypothetical protein
MLNVIMLSVVYAVCRYAECRKKSINAECRYAKCPGALQRSSPQIFDQGPML